MPDAALEISLALRKERNLIIYVFQALEGNGKYLVGKKIYV